MVSPTPLAALAGLKSQAKALRAEMAARNTPMSQAEALEHVARRHGFRDWNTARALSRRNAPDTPVLVGQRVHGRYLGQPFAGEVLALASLGPGGPYRLTLHLDEAVDVVAFDSFSNFRQRITAVIGPNGVSPAKRSDGTPHLEITR